MEVEAEEKTLLLAVFASWESGPRGYILTGQRCLERVEVGVLSRSCLDGSFSNCFLVSSRPVVLEKTVGVPSGCNLSGALVSSAGRCWHSLTSSGDRSLVRSQCLGRTVL